MRKKQSEEKAISPPRAWAEINLDALRNNFRYARKIHGQALMAVVKANAYGHGLEKIVSALHREDGLAYFGVANVGEARRVSDTVGKTTPIYLLGANNPNEREEIVASGWCPCLSSVEEALHYNEITKNYGVRLKVHIAIDTGMGRGGFCPEDLPDMVNLLRRQRNLEPIGIASHLPSADEDKNFTVKQYHAFQTLSKELAHLFPNTAWFHISNSAGLLGYEQGSTNLARPGLMLYGVSPLPECQQFLTPVMSLKAAISLVRTLPPGSSISYGRTYITQRVTRVATIGIGYGDGYPRHLSGQNAQVVIQGQRFPLIGRVTMDQIMVDITESQNICAGDEVELLGQSIPVCEVAEKAGTITWEVLTRVSQRVARTYSN